MGKHLVTHAQVPSARAFVVSTDDFIGFGNSELVFDHFWDAHITMRFSRTFEAVLVSFAN